MQSVQSLSTLDANLDAFFQGGIPSGGRITEFAGEAGTGKTQLCLQLAIAVQLVDGFNAGAAIITTCKRTPIQRLHQLSRHFKSTLGDRLPPNPLNNIHLCHCNYFSFFLKSFEEYLEGLVSIRNVRLIIIDSIASLFRSEFKLDKHSQITKTRILLRIGSFLKRLGAKYGLVIITVNEISLDKPALGFKWGEFIDTRFLLKFVPDPCMTLRQLDLIKPICIDSFFITYFVENSGIIVV